MPNFFKNKMVCPNRGLWLKGENEVTSQLMLSITCQNMLFMLWVVLSAICSVFVTGKWLTVQEVMEKNNGKVSDNVKVLKWENDQITFYNSGRREEKVEINDLVGGNAYTQIPCPAEGRYYLSYKDVATRIQISTKWFWVPYGCVNSYLEIIYTSSSPELLLFTLTDLLRFLNRDIRWAKNTKCCFRLSSMHFHAFTKRMSAIYGWSMDWSLATNEASVFWIGIWPPAVVPNYLDQEKKNNCCTRAQVALAIGFLFIISMTEPCIVSTNNGQCCVWFCGPFVKMAVHSFVRSEQRSSHMRNKRIRYFILVATDSQPPYSTHTSG